MSTPINLTGNLSELQDIIVPDSIGFFPPAPAWGAAAFLLAFFLIRQGYRLFWAYQANRYRREAQKRLDRLEKIILTDSDPGQRRRAAMTLPELLKQTAISAYSRETVAALSQDRWLEFLNEHGRTTDFSGDPGRLLLVCAYETPDRISAVSQSDFMALIIAIGKWIKKHKTEQE